MKNEKETLPRAETEDVLALMSDLTRLRKSPYYHRDALENFEQAHQLTAAAQRILDNRLRAIAAEIEDHEKEVLSA